MIFLRKKHVLAKHRRLVEEFGGSHGLRDEGALESALTAAENRHYYEHADAVICAATYAYHLSQAHAFLDGNKRVAAAMAELFLNVNGRRLNATNDELAELIFAIASGVATRDEVEQKFTEWVGPRM